MSYTGSLHPTMEIIGATESALSTACSVALFCACVLGSRHHSRASHQRTVLQILAAMATADGVASTIWAGASLIRVDSSDITFSWGIFFAFYRVGMVCLIASCVWTCVFAWYIASALERSGAHALWQRCVAVPECGCSVPGPALIHAGVWLLSTALMLLLTSGEMHRSDWEVSPGVFLYSMFGNGIAEAPEPTHPATALGAVSLWTFRLVLFPLPVIGWTFSAMQYCRMRRSFAAARRLTEDALLVDRYALLAAKIDRRLLSYLLIYVVWSVNLLVGCATRPPCLPHPRNSLFGRTYFSRRRVCRSGRCR